MLLHSSDVNSVEAKSTLYLWDGIVAYRKQRNPRISRPRFHKTLDTPAICYHGEIFGVGIFDENGET